MKKVLYITANPKAVEHSFSLDAGKKFIDSYKQKNPQDTVVELDLYKLDIPYVDEDVFSGWGKLANGAEFGTLESAEQMKVGSINSFTDQFIDADKYIFVTPMWNLSLPPKVKVYIDTLMIAGRTFHYTENGPEGLLKDKKALHIHASGGVYSTTGMESYVFGNRYLQSVLGFMGVDDYNSVLLEGTAQSTILPESIKEKANETLQQLVHKF